MKNKIATGALCTQVHGFIPLFAICCALIVALVHFSANSLWRSQPKGFWNASLELIHLLSSTGIGGSSHSAKLGATLLQSPPLGCLSGSIAIRIWFAGWGGAGRGADRRARRLSKYSPNKRLGHAQ
ncbi:MAG: hypothetical protein M1568_01835 [Acidobacteria bacterium]|nr:hypothetical protein [Acidobacteriota bacterium]